MWNIVNERAISMKATVVRKINKLGQLILPVGIRTTLGINANDSVEIYIDENKIILKKYQPGCRECGAMVNLIEGNNTVLCERCLQTLIQENNK